MLQVVIGPQADQLASDINASLKRVGVDRAVSIPASSSPPAGAYDESILNKLLAALGGASNVASIDARSTRMRIAVTDPAKIDEARVQSLGWRGIARPSNEVLHILVGPAAEQAGATLRRLASTYV